MANGFLNAQTYSNVMLLLLKNQLVMGRLVDGRHKNEVTDENGLTTSIKRPPQFIAQNGPTLQAQDVLAGSVSVAVNQYKNVHISISDLEYVQSYNALMQSETMKSAASTLAHAIDSFLAEKTLEFSATAFGGAAGTFDPINTPQQFNAVHTELMENGVPNSDLNAIVTFKDGELMRGALLGGYIDDVNRTALSRVRIPILSEIDVYATQQAPVYTAGSHTMSAGPQVDGASQNVNYRNVKSSMTQTLNLKGLGNNTTIKRGEVFTIAGVFAYDNRNQRALPKLRRFTVLADATASGTGTAAVTVSPAIIVAGSNDGVSTVANSAFATVSAAPADSAALTFDSVANTSYQVRSAFHKRAIALVSAKLVKPMTGESSFATDPETGVSIRYWRGSDIATGQHIHRWDMIFGAENVDRRLGARIWGDNP